MSDVPAPYHPSAGRVLVICQWSATFENANSRKRQRLGFFSAPSGTDSNGYIELASRGADGMAALGVFQAICQYSATLGKSLRGRLVRSDGSALTPEGIATRLRIDTCHLRAALELLCSKEVMWCQWEGGDDPPATHLPPTCQSHPGFAQGEGEGEGEGEGTPHSPPGGGGGDMAYESAVVEPEGGSAPMAPFDQFWAGLPHGCKVGKDAARRAWKKALKRANAETILAALPKYQAYEANRRDRSPLHPSTWLNQGRWEDEIEEPAEALDPELEPTRRGLI